MHARPVVLLMVAASPFSAGAVVSAVPVLTEQEGSLIAVVSFMRTEPGREAEYLGTEEEIWMPVHQERIRQGRMVGWDLYRASSQGGAPSGYTFSTVELFASMSDLQDNISDIFARVHPGLTPPEVAARTEGARQRVRTEIWTRLKTLR